MRKMIRRILSILPAVAVQVLLLLALLNWLSPYAAIINFVFSILALLFVMYIMIKREESTYKTLWLLVILTFPLAGAVLYLCYGNRRTALPLAKRLKEALPENYPQDERALTQLRAEDARIAQTYSYLHRKTGCAILFNESAKYYPLGEDMFADMLEDLRAAKESIYLEYFIIKHGVMLDAILDILREKRREGVDVRILYDDLGSITTFSRREQRKLVAEGFQCVPFNPMLLLSGSLNYRDHKKILAIDGKVAYTGGINLSDEYINQKERFGQWKDIGFRITGPSAQVFCDIFLLFWNAFGGWAPEHTAFLPLRPMPEAQSADGYVATYFDSPVTANTVSNNLYIDILSQAREYVWFYTPYLTPGDELQEAIIRAAERGVDVRIIMPGIPDKKIIYRLSRSYYQALMEAGVKIYEYAPGFVHAKACLSDDVLGTIGTVNLDYRSLFLHFENNTLFYKASLLGELKKDFLHALTLCEEKVPYNRKSSLWRWFIDGILRIFAPLC